MPLAALPDLQAPLAVWAQWYGSQRWPIFPCRGKTPLTSNGFHDATCDLGQLTAWWQQWPDANLATPMGQGRYALDIDPRHGGDDTLFTLERQHGQLPHTLLSHTGGGGDHQIYAEPPGGVRNKANIGAGIDVQGPGSYIILPPSIHPDTRKPYLWDLVDGPDDIDPVRAPAWLEALLQPTSWATTPAPPTSLSPDAPIPEGQRESTLMRLIGAMQRQGATPDTIRAALESENQRCVPPLPAADLDRMARSVGRYPPAPVLDVPPMAPPGWPSNGTHPATPVPAAWQPALPAWRAGLFSKKSGELYQNVFNLTAILSNHDYWQHPDRALWWDAVRGRPMCGADELTDDTLMQMALWFGGAERLPITSIRMLEQCVLARCKTHTRDLLQIWLQGLPAWDQVPRLGHWCTDLAGAAPGDYTSEVGRVLLVSMVARAMQPGCHYRFVVILEGAEEIGKTSLVRALASPEWYVELSIGLETKEAHMMLQGVWVAEFSELDSYTRTEETRMKAFITMQEDSYIPKYSNFRQRTERRAIFVGTTNEGSYLKGQSGNTRYLPLRLSSQVDLRGFAHVRTQLFAEALAYWQAHPDTWWQLSDAALAMAEQEREQRRVKSQYEDDLGEWLDLGRFAEPVYDNNQAVTFVRDETTWREIARWFLRMDSPEKWKDRSLQMQIGAALKALGWQVRQGKRAGRNVNVWRKEPP